jgi:hypothetical protein
MAHASFAKGLNAAAAKREVRSRLIRSLPAAPCCETDEQSPNFKAAAIHHDEDGHHLMAIASVTTVMAELP